MDAFRRADETLVLTESKGLLKADDHVEWRADIVRSGALYLDAHQQEAVKCCFLRIPAYPVVSDRDRLHALEGMARYHKVRNEWDPMIKRCEEALVLLPEAKKNGDIELMESGS